MLPSDAFKAVVPVLIGLGLVMVLAGPRLQRRAARRGKGLEAGDHGLRGAARAHSPVGIYGGYFGAAEGVLLVGLLSVVTTETLQRLTASKYVFTNLSNAFAASVFILIAWDRIEWRVVALIAAGAFLGGFLGAT